MCMKRSGEINEAHLRVRTLSSTPHCLLWQHTEEDERDTRRYAVAISALLHPGGNSLCPALVSCAIALQYPTVFAVALEGNEDVSLRRLSTCSAPGAPAVRGEFVTSCEDH